MQSEKLDLLVAALIKARAKFPAIPKKGYNPVYKSHYTKHEDVIDATKAPLAENGLVVVHRPSNGPRGQIGVRSELRHVSDQFLATIFYGKPDKESLQGYASAITYIKRYNECGLLNTHGDDDTDGAQVSSDGKSDSKSEYKDASGNSASTQQRTITPNPAKAHEKISEPQQKRLFAIAKNKGWGAQDVAVYLEKAFGLNSSGDILRKDYEAICTLIETISPMKAMKEIEKKDVNLPPSHMPPVPPDFGEIPF